MTDVYTETIFFQDPNMQNVVYKNKLIVLLLDAFGFGNLGLDRIYLGCYLSGVLKFSILVFGILLLFTPNRDASLAGAALLTVSFIWNLIDTATIFYNAITEQRGLPFLFCRTNRPVRWKNYQNIVDGKNYALALLLLYIVLHTGLLGGAYKTTQSLYSN